MYYSKNSPTRHGERIIVPENYSGNAFRVKDETDRHTPPPESTYINEDIPSSPQDIPVSEPSEPVSESVPEGKKERERKDSFLSGLMPPKSNGGLLSSIFHDIDIEDILIFALIFLIYQDDSDDDVLLLLIILLFLK